MINVCIAGATGWVGRALVYAASRSEDLILVSAVSRSAAGQTLKSADGSDVVDVPIYASVAEALDDVDVLIDYTSHDVVMGNTLGALERGVNVVIGSSGLTAEDYAQIDAVAREAGVGVVAAGNFSLTAALAQAAALLAAPFFP